VSNDEWEKLPESVKHALLQLWEVPKHNAVRFYVGKTRFQILDDFLRWEGIIGYSGRIAAICLLKEE
jgi:hypothetical protein